MAATGHKHRTQNAQNTQHLPVADGPRSWACPRAAAQVRAILDAYGDDPYGAEAELCRAPALDCDEATFQHAIEVLAAFYGWLAFHDRDPRRDLAGFPDLVMAGQGRCLYRELKTMRGRLAPMQGRWRDALHAAGADWALWRPCDWPQIVATLRGDRGDGDGPTTEDGARSPARLPRKRDGQHVVQATTGVARAHTPRVSTAARLSASESAKPAEPRTRRGA